MGGLANAVMIIRVALPRACALSETRLTSGVHRVFWAESRTSGLRLNAPPGEREKSFSARTNGAGKMVQHALTAQVVQMADEVLAEVFEGQWWATFLSFSRLTATGVSRVRPPDG